MKLSFKIIGYGGWKLFWQLMRKWLSEKFEGVSAAIANIDLSPISNKVDEVKSDVADVKADVADVKTDVADVKTAVENINVESADQLAEFFGVTLLQGYEFMTDTEVTDELEDIMQAIDPDLTAEQAASITAEAMQIINDDEEQS